MRKLIVLMVATMSVVSVAQTQKSEVKPRVTEFVFEGDLIPGDLSRPDVEYFTPGSHALHPSLIKVRQEFKEKVMESAGQL